MRTLLIDNYDSFTFNLYQHLAAVNEELPIVVRNDDMSWSELSRLQFDNIVISPGPGRPEREADFGVCTKAILEANVPVLGVCLGHQGICHLFGGRVDLAPEVMHGRLSPIWHDGEALFRGLPCPFNAVRYHSLVAAELPDHLEATAWTDDGLIMGLRHRERPIWGVQFHPESICTEHGMSLLANFRELTRSTARRSSSPVSMRPSTPQQRTPSALAIETRRLDLDLDPEAVFNTLYGDSRVAFWLDSSRVIPGLSRFSFMGDASGPLSEHVLYDAPCGTLEIETNATVTRRQEDLYEYLQRQLAARRVETPEDLPFDFNLGYVGYLGYEMKALSGSRCPHESPVPDSAFIFADRIIAFDHQERCLWLVCCDEPEMISRALDWLDRTEARLRNFPPPPPSRTQVKRGPAPRLTMRHDPKAYAGLIEECKRQIRHGETYEVCLTNTVSAPGCIEPLKTYSALRRINPAPYSAFLRFDDLSVLCSSPERFLRVTSDKVVESKPIKGTIRRGETSAEDTRLRDQLQNSVKDRAENLMIVDLLRNDLGRVCEIGSVHVPVLFGIESYATVHQLVSTVRGRLLPQISAVECARTAFPGGSMTGAPKLRTMEIIDRLEQGPRGVYSGAIGFFALNGAADLNIVIRTIVATNEGVSFGVGGAIIALSDPELEIDETVLKGRALVAALTEAGIVTPDAPRWRPTGTRKVLVREVTSDLHAQS